MAIKNHVINVSEVLVRASIVGIGLYLGEGFGTTVVAGLGINLSSAILDSGLSKLKEKWLSSNDGVLNHDIQQALVRAFIKTLESLEKKYLALEETDELSKEKKDAIKSLFQELRSEAGTVFLSLVEKAANDQEIKGYLYGDRGEAKTSLWNRIEDTELIYTYYGEHFKNFLRDNSLDEVVFWFGEELKTDSKENNRAWRAFQRMLLEGIQADVKAVHAGQDEIKQDLKILGKIRKQLSELKNTIDRRLPNEPFQESFAKALTDIETVVRDAYKATKRIEEKQDIHIETTSVIASDVKKLLGEKTKTELTKIPDDIQVLFDEGNDLLDAGKYEDARAVFQKSLDRATGYGNVLVIAVAKYYLAVILDEWDKNSTAAKTLLQECLKEIRTINSEKHGARVLYRLGSIELHEGNLDEAGAYFAQSLEIDKTNDNKGGVANNLHMLGWLEDHHGNSGKALELYDQSLIYWLSIYQEGNPETIKEAAQRVAGEYQHKGLIYENLGNVEEAESNYIRALEWHRKSIFKPDLGKILYLLARLKFREAEYDKGAEFLDEAMAIYNDIGDHSWYARCLHLKGQVHFTLGHTDEATAIFESSLKEVEKSGDYKEQESYLNTLGDAYLKAQKIRQAKEYFGRARNLSLNHELLDGYAASVENLSKIAHIEKDDEERNRLLLEGIQTLETFLLSVQGQPKRAFIKGQIGFFYEGMENFDQALIYYQKAEKSYDSLSDIGGRANSLGSIARMKGLLGRKTEEIATYRQLRKILDGSRYYDLIAGTTLNLGVFEMRIGNLDEAQILFQEAELLCRKYNLSYLPTLNENIKRLDVLTKARKPPELNFRQLVEELFEWVEWFPEAKDSILRLWMEGRSEALFSNFRNTAGVKFMLCQDDVDTFLRTSDVLYPYSDLCLQVVGSKYPNAAIDFIPFPMDKNIFFDCAVPYKKKIDDIYTTGFVSGSFSSRYALTSDRVHSKITGNEGVLISGWSPGLPDQAHKLILSTSAEDLIRRRIFFLPGERFRADDKLLADLDHSTVLGLIPVYFDSLPPSENVRALHEATIDLPIISADNAEKQKRQIRKVKRAFAELLPIAKESVRSVLNNFIFEVEELSDVCGENEAVPIQIYILEFPGAVDKELHVAMVI
jgi:tetratricopeptide (TPR) repeat protein